MNLVYLVWHYLKARPLNTILNIILLGLGVAVITVMLLANVQLQRRVEETTRGIDLVIGAKGSPMQLILSSIFHIDVPTGNIKLRDAERFARGPFVKQAIPLALGDNYKAYRIVGTNQKYPLLYDAKLAQGSWWHKPMEVSVGYVVHLRTGLKSGDHFSSAHGLVSTGHTHEDQPYVVAGVMSPTGSILDELILTSVESIWRVHELGPDEKSLHDPADSLSLAMRSPLVSSVARGDSLLEITSMLIQYRSALAAIQLPRIVNSNSALQAASPAFEAARLFSVVGAGADLLMAFAYLLVIIAAMSIFIALYNSLRERRYDMAIMRAMGASKAKLFVAIIMEGAVLCLLGTLLGLTLGHVALILMPVWLEETAKAGITGMYFHPLEVALIATSLILGIICALLPAIEAYKTDISEVLAGNG